MSDKLPWHGVLVATALPFKEDLSVDWGAFADHLRWLADNGCDGAAVNGSLGEYQNLTDEERARAITTAVEATPDDFVIMAGAAAYGTHQSVHWAQQAKDAGADCLMLLPPNTYRATDEGILNHFREVAKVGLPIVAYNNPIDTKCDLTPKLLAQLHEEGCIVGVKEFSGDVRRAYEIKERAPGLDLLIGTDDTLLEVALAGAVGWVSGYPNALPKSNCEMYHLAVSDSPEDVLKARDMYRDLHPLLRWDSKTEFVQAIKLSMDIVGRYGGPCRPPRLPMSDADAAAVRADTEAAVAKGY